MGDVIPNTRFERRRDRATLYAKRFRRRLPWEIEKALDRRDPKRNAPAEITEVSSKG